MNTIKEITLKDLKEDESFFKDLREGNFVLVLGAGFSYGVPSKAGSKIPIGNDFANLTKGRFNIPHNLDYSSAAEIWEEEIASNPELIYEFRNLFLVDETKFDFNTYSSIFLPRWHNIFSLNFDNVLECTQEKTKRKKLKVYSYPCDTSGDSEPNIFHLHGLINQETSLDKIVFTPGSYLKLDLRLHDLYDVLHGDVGTHAKKILIVGSQFKEQIVRKKFFKELPGDKRVKIFHFDINTQLEYVKEFTDRDYTFIPLKDGKGNVGTELFLQFLDENKHKIKNISLDGALTINRGFVDKINQGERFSRSKFYSSKQDENCQWYGILNGFDIERKSYQKIKKEAINAFSKQSTSKVAAVVHGNGGCGKSTLLRKLAIDLIKESDFEIIWVKDRELEDFVLYSLPEIRNDEKNRYLVFVEDWYRLTGQNDGVGKNLLDESQSIKNIRLIIGDRDLKDKYYMYNLINTQNTFKLTEAENKIILEKIISKHTKWKKTSELVLKNEESFNSPLFFILFAIMGISEGRIDDEDINYTDVENTVRRIARYDLRKITGQYPGFARALHYWSCIYANNKIFITYDCFLKIADSYNGNNEISLNFKNWKMKAGVLDKLKLYIHVSSNEDLARRFRNIEFVQFNHDKLAESILSKIELENWETYDDFQKRKLLNVVTEIGDDYSASVLLKTFLDFENQIFQGSQEMKYYIDKLFYEKKNRDFKYLSYITKLNLTPSKLLKYIDKLKEDNLYHNTLWLEYFKVSSKEEKQNAAKTILEDENITSLQYNIVVAAFNQAGNKEEKQKAAKIILDAKNITTLQPPIVVAAFKQAGNEAEKQDAARIILADENITTLQFDFVVAAFNQPGNKDEKQDAAKTILNDENITALQPEIVVAAFNQPGNKDEKQDAARIILDDENIITLQPAIVVAAFKQPGNEAEKQDAAKIILDDENITTLPHHIVVAAFNQAGNKAEKQDAAKIILDDENITTLQPDIVVASFNQAGNEDEKQNAAKIILDDENITTLQYDFVVVAFKQAGNKEEKQDAAKKILNNENITTIQRDIVVTAFNQEGNKAGKQKAAKKILSLPDWKENDVLLIYVSLKAYSEDEKIPGFISGKVRELIDDYLGSRNDKKKFIIYNLLMRIPFHKIGIWKNKSRYIIRHWDNLPRVLINNVLFAYCKHPEEVKAVCMTILKKWKEEIDKPIFVLYGKPHKGDHVIKALGHQNLEPVAKTTAKEILLAADNELVDIPENLLEIAKKIVEENEFPGWDIKVGERLVSG